MTYRSRPAPRRRHRARWQDELRTQRLLVGAFAAAIAIALGVFGISAWSAYFDGHLRQVMVVEGTAVSRDAFDLRQTIIGSELQATGLDLNNQLGGARDAVLQQQLSVISDQFQNLTSTAAGSIEDGLFQATRAGGFGLSVSDAEIDAEVTARQNLPARVKLSLISFRALPDDAASGATPTDEDFARAKDEADQARADLDAGGDFATIATAQSDDAASAQADGLVGWVSADDIQYGYLFPLAEGAENGDLVGPEKTDTGWVILRVEDRTPAGPFTTLLDLLDGARVTDADYRAYIGDELMRRAFRGYFEDEIVVSPAPQRDVAQILILQDQGVPVPKQRIRHLLAQPLPGADDQSTATQAEWDAALARAQGWYEEVQDPNADWFEIAKESDDPGSRGRGGDLGWYDPTTGNFVPEFEAAVATLGVGEISEPVKTDFGYHVIQVTDQRVSALDFATNMIVDLQADPESFADRATADSEDSATRSDGGHLGWVAHYETDAIREEAIFALTDVGQISAEPVVDGNQIWIFKLVDTSEDRIVEKARLDTIRSTGYDRWYATVQKDGQIWVDTQLTLDSAPAA